MGLLRIGPFNYNPLRGVDLWLEQPDEVILQHLSTAPEVEPPHFVMQVSCYCCTMLLQHLFSVANKQYCVYKIGAVLK